MSVNKPRKLGDMLPDWPETKERIGESFLRHVQLDAEARLGILGRIPRVVVHEGDGTGMSRSDGSRTEQGFAEIGATLSIGLDEFAGMPIPAIIERLRDVAEELAGGRAAHAMSVIGEACNEAGNVVDAVGGSSRPSMVFKLLDASDRQYRRLVSGAGGEPSIISAFQ